MDGEPSTGAGNYALGHVSANCGWSAYNHTSNLLSKCPELLSSIPSIFSLFVGGNISCQGGGEKGGSSSCLFGVLSLAFTVDLAGCTA